MLNARTDTWFGGATGDVFDETVERATRYVEAGADCVFVPGVVEEDDVRRLAEAVPYRSTSWPGWPASRTRRRSSRSA